MSRYFPLEPIQSSSDLKSVKTIWGELFQGGDADLDREVWLLKFRQDQDRAAVEDRARSYVGLASRIGDPSLFTALDYDSDNHCLVTETGGESLRDFILRKGPMKQGVARKFLERMLNLFARFEEQNFVHGDVGAGTFFLEANWQEPAKLTELPVKLFTSLGYELNGVVLSQTVTAKYCAPETCNPDFGAVSTLSDLYSLAFVTLEMLVGSEFDSYFNNELHLGAPNWIGIHGGANAEELPPVKTFVPKIAPDLEDALSSMLRRNPAERPKSAKLVLEKLDFSTNDEEIDNLQGESEEENPVDSIVYTSLSDLRRNGEIFSPHDSDGDALEVAPKKDLLCFLKETFYKPYVLWPLSSFILVALTSYIVSCFAEVQQWRPIKTNLNDAARYAHIYRIEDSKNSDAKLIEVPKQFVKSDEGYVVQWKLSNRHRLYRIEVDGYDPREVWLSQKSLDGRGSAELDFGAPQQIAVTIKNGELAGYSAYCDGDARLAPSNSLDLGNYRVGVFRAGFKPTELAVINADYAPSVPTEEYSSSPEANKVAEEVYRLLGAVPVEWQTYLPKKEYDKYDQICREYFSLFDSDSGKDASAFESVRKKTLEFFESATSALFETRPIYLSCSPNDVWAKTRKAFERIANIEKESEREGEWKPIDFWISATNAQISIEQACFLNTVLSLREPENKGDVETKGGTTSFHSEMKKAEERCDTDAQRIVLARLWARRSLVAYLKALKHENGKPKNIAELFKQIGVTDSYKNAAKILDALGSTESSEYAEQAERFGYAEYLRACARLQIQLYGEDVLDDSVKAKLNEQFSAAIEYFQSESAKKQFGDQICMRRANVARILKSEVLAQLKKFDDLNSNTERINLTDDLAALFACYYKFYGTVVDKGDKLDRGKFLEKTKEYYGALKSILNDSKAKTLGSVDFLDCFISDVDGEFLPCAGYVHVQFGDRLVEVKKTPDERKKIERFEPSAHRYVAGRLPFLPTAPLESVATTTGNKEFKK